MKEIPRLKSSTAVKVVVIFANFAFFVSMMKMTGRKNK